MAFDAGNAFNCAVFPIDSGDAQVDILPRTGGQQYVFAVPQLAAELHCNAEKFIPFYVVTLQLECAMLNEITDAVVGYTATNGIQTGNTVITENFLPRQQAHCVG